MWRHEAGRRRERIELETEVVAQQVAYRLEAWIAARVAVVAHFADQWESVYQGAPELHEREVRAFVERLPGIQAINWVDAAGVIRRVAPLEPNLAAREKDLHDHPHADVLRALSEATRTGEPHRTTSEVPFFQGGTGFAFYWPVETEDEELLGYLNGVFRVEDLVEQCLSEESLHDRFRLEISERDGFVAYGEEAGEGWPFERELEVAVVDRPWVLRLAPSPANLAGQSGPAIALLLVGGLLAPALISWLLGLALRRHAALREREAQLALLLQSTVEGVFGVDLQGRFSFCNAACLEILGYDSAEELLGRPAHALLHHATREGEPIPEEDCAIARAMRSGEAVHRDDESFRRRDGTILPIEFRARPIDGRPGPHGAVVTFTDIRERLAAERERNELELRMQQSQKMESLGLLAGGVAHDFNNLLVGILGNASLAMEEVPESSSLFEQLDTISTAAERAAELTGQLLTYSGRQQLEPQEVDLPHLVEEMAQLLRASIPKRIDLQLHEDPGVVPVVGDPTQLRQVVMNLITNAAEALGEEPGVVQMRVSMEVPPREGIDDAVLGVPPTERAFCVLEVSDAGKGMSPETLQRVFDPFFTTKSSGRGLGLSAVLGIVARHGGALEVRSSPGRGSRFRVFLPPAEREAGLLVPSPRRQAPAPEGGSKILVVDDEPVVRDLVRRAVERAGFEVLLAATGEEAMRVFEQQVDDLDLVLMDLSMSGIGGVEASARMHAVRPGLPIVLTSGHAAESSVLEAEQFLTFLRKPFRSEALLAALLEALALSSKNA